MDFTQARTNMVKSQLLPNDVQDPQILGGFMRVSREMFIDPAARELAYSDHALSMDGGERRCLKPLQVSLLLQALEIKPGHRVLILGAGTGYEAAVAAETGAEVFAVEADAELAARGEQLTRSSRVRWLVADPTGGWPEEGPYQAILLCGAVESVPPRPLAQLDPEGQLTGIIGSPGDVVMRAVRVQGSGAHGTEPLFETVAPPLGGTVSGQRFVL